MKYEINKKLTDQNKNNVIGKTGTKIKCILWLQNTFLVLVSDTKYIENWKSKLNFFYLVLLLLTKIN